MKKTKQKILRFIVFLSFIQLSLNLSGQQIHVNREWRSETGDPVFNPLLTPYGGDWTKSIVTATNDIITIGHTAVSGQGENILITRYSEDGGIIWQTDYNSSSTYNDYGVNLTEDASGNIYVCGVSDNGGITNYDIIVLMYDANGNLQYSTSFDGSSNLNDICSDIKIDTYGNINISGTTEESSTSYDYLLVNYDPSLNFNWKSTYDYANLYDFAASLEISGGKINLAGASASSSTDWDYTIASFDESTGAYLNDTRDNLPGVGYDEVYAFRKDAVGNSYVTGKASSNGINYDIRTLKISPTNSILWTQTYDAYGFEDIGSTLAIDANGNVIVGGYVTKSNNKKEYIILKYNSSGTLLWQQTQASKDNSADAYIKAITLNNTNDIYFIGGEKGISANKQAIVGKISNDGYKKWEKAIKGNYDYLPSDIQYGGFGTPGIYAIAIKDSTVNSYEMSYFTEFERDTTNVYGSNGPLFKKSEILIRFNKNIMNLNKTDNKDITYGTLADFIDSTGLANLNSYLRTTTDEYKVFKVYPNLASKDSLSISRTGNTVKLLPFYATLGVIFPNGINDTNTVKSLRDAVGIVSTADLNYYFELSNSQDLNSLFPKNENAMSSSSLNDPDYINGNSAGLDAMGSYTNAHINVSPAWNISTGDPSIIVGVYDTGINKTHQDFNHSSLSNSKISTGYDYYNNMPLYNVTPFDRLGHGSGIAGIIGGIRNNGVAVSGVAGGDASINQTGVTLHDMKLFEGNTINTNCASVSYNAITSIIASSIVDGAISNPTANIGLAQHAQNLSFEFRSSNPMPYNEIQVMKDALRTSFVNEVLVSFAAGNNENSSFTTGIYNQPTRTKDEWCLTVGANNENNLRANFSCGSKYLDFVAPGTVSLYNLVDKSNSTSTTDNFLYGSSNSCTATANGTSFSSPYAVGLAALMMSHVNTNSQKINDIAPEDIEQLMEKYATDITTYSVGYDAQTGYGRINAGAAMAKIEIPFYNVQHVNVVTTMSNCSVALTGSLESVWYPYVWSVNSQTLPAGFGNVNKYEITYTSSHNIGSYNLVDSWKRDATSNLLANVASPTAAVPGGDFDLPNEPNITLVSANSSNAVLKGYTYEIMALDQSTWTYTTVGWYPFNINNPSQQIKFGYTLHTAVPNVGVNNLDENLVNLILFPNPSDDSFTILLNSNQKIDAEITVYDVTGKVVYQNTKYFDGQSTNYKISTKNLSSGIYFVNLKGGNNLNKTFKQVVSH